MLPLAWLLSILGAVVAFIVSLAGAMKTVPQLPWREAVVGVPLPVLAGVSPSGASSGRPGRRTARVAGSRPEFHSPWLS